MKYTCPSYYKDFHCIASQCPETCCGGWNISIDPESLNRYRRLTGQREDPFCQKLRSAVDFKRKTIRLTDRRCPLLTRDRLCSLFIHFGPDFMCRTCRTYPRHREELGNLREISLSLSCPEAARLILSQPERPGVITKYTDTSCPPEQRVDEKRLRILLAAREIILDIIWNTAAGADCPDSSAQAVDGPDSLTQAVDKPDSSAQAVHGPDSLTQAVDAPNSSAQATDKPDSLAQAAAMALAFSHDLQRHINAADSAVTPENLAPLSEKLSSLALLYLRKDAPVRFLNQLKKHRNHLEQDVSCALRTEHLLDLYSTLEPVVEDWDSIMSQVIEANPVLPGKHHPAAADRQLLTYFITVYGPGAIYDHRFFEKIQFAVISWIMIRLMAEHVAFKKRSQLHIDAKNLTDSDRLTHAAYLYSRQVENSDDHLNAIFDACSCEKEFQLFPLLAVLLPEHTA